MKLGREKPVRRICVVRLGGMGDILLATPAVRALSQHFNTTEIDFIVGKGMKPALEGIPYLGNIIEFNKDGDDARLSNFLPFLRTLRAREYDLFVNFQPSSKTHLMAFASGASRHITFRKDRRKQRDTGRVRHAIDDFTKELRPLGIPAVPDRHLDFFIPDEAHNTVRELLAAEGIASEDKILAINPAGTRDINRWPAPKFSAFLLRMAREMPEVRLILTGGPGDVALAREIAAGASASGVLNLAARLSVKELGALLARADTVLTGDTGPLHIASAVDAPLVCLSGAADPDRSGPTAPRDLVVIQRELPCVPCQGRFCRRGDIACMTQMPVDRVFEAVRRQLAPPAPFGGALFAGTSVPLDFVSSCFGSAETGTTRCNGTLPPAGSAPPRPQGDTETAAPWAGGGKP